MRNYFWLLLSITSGSLLAQVKGTITDTQNKPLSFVSIYLDNTFTGTTSNDNGDYILDVSKKGTYTIVFQFLGYKTVKKNDRHYYISSRIERAIGRGKHPTE